MIEVDRLNKAILKWSVKLQNDFYRFFVARRCVCGDQWLLFYQWGMDGGLQIVYSTFMTYKYPTHDKTYQYGMAWPVMTMTMDEIPEILDRHLDLFKRMIVKDVAVELDTEGGSFRHPQYFQELAANYGLFPDA